MATQLHGLGQITQRVSHLPGPCKAVWSFLPFLLLTLHFLRDPFLSFHEFSLNPLYGVTRAGFNTLNAFYPLMCTHFVASGADMTPSCSAPLSPARGPTPTDEGFGDCVLGFLSSPGCKRCWRPLSQIFLLLPIHHFPL